MWHAVRNKQEPVCLATQPGCVAAVQVRQQPGAPAKLLQAKVLYAGNSSSARLDHMVGSLGLKNARLNLLLESGEYQFLQTEMPQVPVEEIHNALRWQIKDLLRHSPDDTTFGCVAIPENRLGRQVQSFVTAVSNALVLERMLQFRYCKSQVEVIDAPELAQRNIAEKLGEADHAKLVLSISPAGCLLTASRNGVLYFTRNFDLVSDSIASDPELRRAQFDRLLLELQRSIDVLEHQYNFMSAPALWLAPFAHIDELLTLLIENLYLPVHRIELEQLFDCSSSPLPSDANEQAILFQVLGLALRGSEPTSAQINLVNSNLLPPQPFFQLQRMAWSLAAIALVAGTGLLLIEAPLRELEQNAASAQQRIVARQEKLKASELRLGLRQPNPKLASEVTQLGDEQTRLAEIIRQLAQSDQSAPRRYSGYLYALSAAVMPGVWLTDIEFRDAGISLYGMSLQAEALPVYLDRLNKQSVFRGLTFEHFALGHQNALTASVPAALVFKLESSSAGAKP